MLVDTLAAKWGCYLTPQARPCTSRSCSSPIGTGGGRGPAGSRTGTVPGSLGG